MSGTLDHDLQEIHKLLKPKHENKPQDENIPQIIDRNITYLSVIIVVLIILVIYLLYRVYKVNKDSKMVENIIEHRDKVKKAVKSKLATENKRQQEAEPEVKKPNTEHPHAEPGDVEEQKHADIEDNNNQKAAEPVANADFTCDINQDDALNMLDSINKLVASN